MSPAGREPQDAHDTAAAASATTPLVLPLALAAEAPPSIVGGKARGLGALLAGGFDVPAGVVVTASACAALLEGAGVGAAPAELRRRTAAPPSADEDRWLATVRARVESASVPAALAAALRAAADGLLGGGAVAVRSSGALEDRADASFAGQYETVLGARGEAAVLAAIRRCVGSLFTPRLAAYLRAHGGARALPAMAVVVQRQLEPDVAGVLFSVNPMTGRETETVIEAAFGLADALVSGTVPADHLVVDQAAGRVLSRAHGAVAPDGAGRSTLDDGAAIALARLGAAVQEHLGFPVDVEWARAGGRVQLVQARPITRLHFAPDLGEWTTADFRDGGVSSDVCASLMWSLYEAAFDLSMPRYLRSIGLVPRGHRAKWSRMFFGRPYWNLGEARAAVLRLPGFVERNFDLDLGIVPAYEGTGRVTPATPRTVLPAIPVLVRLHLGYRRRRRENARFLAAFPDRARPFDAPPAALEALPAAAYAAALRALVESLHLDTEASYFETIYNTSNAKLDFKVAFDRAARRVEGGLDYPTLVGGLLDLSHVRTLVDLHATVGALRRAGRPLDDGTVAAFAARWPHRSRKELDLRAPRWPEDLAFVRELMEQAHATWSEEADPARTARTRHDAYLAERDRALRALPGPLDRATFRSRLARLRTFTWEREEMRDRSSRVYALVRRWMLEAGRRLAVAGTLADPGDVFTLRREEVLGAVDGTLPSAEVRRRARAGLRTLRSFRSFDAPNEIGSTHGLEPHAPPPPGAALRGAGCSPGRARGVARVVRRIEDASRIQPGDVLVAPFTDPGWTTIFPRLAAVVTETGGLLSHAAVIARECGIPAVLAVDGATRAIPDGARVEVDGRQGTVSVLDGST
ncbi:PEP/pyruvate-binding domain-containing protein [Anaeromyxobacter oryzae]|uniref:Phosphoenolpyruvate synthase n=1 Tax=Anaeromyxobacter oryzae TaxID=2918170 RepID=A0ABM7WPA4_9BACT|nr:PEP/pyruvate-binding domain-containing protein [Anaeromyxobacter oryzae]BDG01290.1 phosphoenolpyruvate synthase [Anaeromyxobacter oryzae]